MIYHVKWTKNDGNFLEAVILLIYTCGRIIQNFMSAVGKPGGKVKVRHALWVAVRLKIKCALWTAPQN